MRAIGRVLGIHHKTVSRWLAQAAQSLLASTLQTEACSFIEIGEIFTFVAKKISVLALASSRLHLWQGPRLCLWEQIKISVVLWEQFKHLLTMGYGTDLLKSYHNFSPHAKHYAEKTFITQIESLKCWLRHYLSRLYRETHYFSKTKTLLKVSLKLLIHKLNTPWVPMPGPLEKIHCFQKVYLLSEQLLFNENSYSIL